MIVIHVYRCIAYSVTSPTLNISKYCGKQLYYHYPLILYNSPTAFWSAICRPRSSNLPQQSPISSVLFLTLYFTHDVAPEETISIFYFFIIVTRSKRSINYYTQNLFQFTFRLPEYYQHHQNRAHMFIITIVNTRS